MPHPDIASFAGSVAHWGLPPVAALLVIYLLLRLLRAQKKKHRRSAEEEQSALENQERAIKKALARTGR